MGPLLHSLLDLEPLVTDLLVAVRPKTVLEIGVGDGYFSKVLEKCCTGIGAALTSVDPKPAHTHVGTVAEKSLAFLETCGARYDVAIIDGDHNYYTVKHELELLYQLNPDTIFVLHDVGWPCARRDMYYAPADIPIDYRHEHSWMLGADPRHEELVPWGFRGEGQFAMALKQGGPRNGVLTAVEDFLQDYCGFELHVLPSVFGLGILFRPGVPGLRKWLDHVSVFSEPYYERPQHELLLRLERNRVELFCDRLRMMLPR